MATARPTPVPAPVTSAIFAEAIGCPFLWGSSGRPQYHKSARSPPPAAPGSTRQRCGNFVGLKSACCLQARRNFGNTDRPPEAVALHGVHPGRTQEQLLVGRFDAFGGDLHSEATAEADDRVHNGGGVRGLLDRAHETAVNLKLVERKAPQVEQA